MASDFEDKSLLGQREWITIASILIAIYLYRAFRHLLPFSFASSASSSVAPINLNDEEQRRSIQEARRKLLEASERKIEENREKLKEKEEEKRRQQLERAERLLDISKKPSSSSTSFRKDYNPLMGDGGSCWRPTKPRPARGG